MNGCWFWFEQKGIGEFMKMHKKWGAANFYATIDNHHLIRNQNVVKITFQFTSLLHFYYFSIYIPVYPHHKTLRK